MGSYSSEENTVFNLSNWSEAFTCSKKSSVTGDGKMEKDPRKRHSNEFHPPYMSELRIVLLGRCGEEKSKVGNIILRREAFETHPSSFTVEQQCERARGLVDGSHVTVINTPDLLHPQITQHEIDKQVELCVSLSDPGPHVLLLVLQPDGFTEKDRDRMKKIVEDLGDQAFSHTMVLVTHEKMRDVCIDEQKDPIASLIKECKGRCLKFNNINNADHAQIFQFMEEIVVKENDGKYLTSEIFQEAESGATSIPQDSQTRCAQDVERENKPQSQGEKDTQDENVDIPMSELRIVLLGRSGEGKSKVGNAILCTDAFSVRDKCQRRRTEVNGKHVAVINTPDLLDPDIPDRKLSHQIETCVNLSAPGPHAFLLVLQNGQFSDDDRRRLQRILGFFSAEAFKYSVVLVSRSKKHLMDHFCVKKVVKKCNGRSYNLEDIFSKVTELMEKIEQMVQENGGGFLNCQIFKSVTKGERLNLVVFGRRGVGKTSTVNAILGQRESSVDPSPSSVPESREGEVCGRLVTVVELPTLCEVQPSVSTVSHLFTSVCGPGVHAFLLVIQVGSLTDDDKAEISRIQETFGSRVTDYMMVLFIHETPSAKPVVDFVTQRKDMQEPLKFCNERFCIFNNQDLLNNPIVPELLRTVEKMNKEAGSCFSLDMYLKSQLERNIELEARHNIALEEKDRRIKELEESIKGKSLGVEVKGQISDCVRIVLVGKTGNGKSATGNTILQRNEFKSDLSSKSVTTCCQKGVGDVAGRRVVVVDTPGLFDTSVNNEQVQQEIAKCISFLAPGPHVFLLVLQLGRMTQEEKDTLQLIKNTFGKMAEMFTIVLFTRGDDLNKPIESFIQSSEPMLQNLVHNCGGRVQVFNNKDQSNVTQVTELLEKIDMMVQKNGGGCYTNEMFQEAERTIKKECERILREKEGEMQRERETLKAKHEEEMEEMKRRMEEQRCIEEEERARREKELKDKEENLKKEIEALKRKELEANERRDEEEKRWKSQELEWKSKIDEKEEEKRRIKEELKYKEEEEKKRLETAEKERQELLQKQEREKREFEKKLAEEKEKRDREEQEKRNQEERKRKEWEERIKESQKEKREIQEDMQKRAAEWELQREKERIRTEEKWKQKEEQERKEWEEKQKKMRDEFEKEKEKERLKRERDKEIMEKDLEEKKRQLKQKEEEWEKERKEKREKRYKEDEQRREEERKRLVKLQEEFEEEREEENQRRKKEEKSRREREEEERREIEEDHERKIKEMKSKYEEEARKQAEEFNDFREKYKREFSALMERHEEELIQLKEEHEKQVSFETALREHDKKSLKDEIAVLNKKHEEEIEAFNEKHKASSSCVVL